MTMTSITSNRFVTLTAKTRLGSFGGGGGGGNKFHFLAARGRPVVKTTLLQQQQCRFMSSSVINLSDLDATEKFSQLNHKSVLYFTATWCPPCKAIKPVYEELSGKYSDVAFGKIDVDDNADAALEFNISAVPTFIFMDGEEQMERFSGADPNQLESLIKDLDSR